MSCREPDYPASEVGQYLRKLREKENFSLGQLQDYLGFSGITLYTIESTLDRPINKVISNQILMYLKHDEELINALRTQNWRILSKNDEI